MSKFHVNDKGEAGHCGATAGRCPFGGDDNHFASQDEARKAYEVRMEAEILTSSKKDVGHGVRELNALAKVTDDEAILADIIARGSDRTLRNLAKNSRVSSEVLAAAYQKTDNAETRALLAGHPAFPIEQMSPNEFATRVQNERVYARQQELLNSENIGDEHIVALKESAITSTTSFVLMALRNPNNKISEEKLIELAESSWLMMGAAQASNRYPADRIRSLPSSLIYWGNVDRTSNPDYLDAYADWAISMNEVSSHDADYYSERVAMNPETGSGTLRKLAANDLALSQVYNHPRADVATRNLALQKSEEVKSMAKIDELQEAYGGQLKDSLVYVENTNRPFGSNRGIADTMVRFNTERVAELGLEPRDILTLMNSKRFNGGGSYDPVTGIFRGTVDSTD